MFCSQQLPSAPGASLYFVSPLSPVLCSPHPLPLPGHVWRAARAALCVRRAASLARRSGRAAPLHFTPWPQSELCDCVVSWSPHCPPPPSPLNIGSQGSNQTYPASSYYAIAGEHMYVVLFLKFKYKKVKPVMSYLIDSIYCSKQECLLELRTAHTINVD